VKLAFTVDGRSVEIEAAPDRRLVDILRDDLGIVTVKNSCGIGRCGACVVVVDGRLLNSCLVLAAKLPEAEVLTLQGLGEPVRPVQAALAAAGAVQCGYCASGLVTALTWLRQARPDASADEAAELLSGQICRCTGYGGLRRAIQDLFR
jgi:carbon-monoxide dehydrogenase small subunit